LLRTIRKHAITLEWQKNPVRGFPGGGVDASARKDAKIFAAWLHQDISTP